jgi:hypothetical protein
MKRAKTVEDVQRIFLSLNTGDLFVDHQGREVFKIGDTDVVLGPGYNNDMPIREYFASVQNDNTYGAYVLPLEA